MGGVPIWLNRLTFDGPLGRIFGPVDLDAPAGALVTVAGPAGSGRSSLLLAAAGRLRGVNGKGLVGGHRIPGREARRLVLVVRITGVVQTDEHRRVRNLMRDAPRGDLRPPHEDDLVWAWQVVDYKPEPGARFGELPAVEQLLVDLGLAVAARPAAIVVDDVDVGLLPVDRHRVWRALRSVADIGTTVVVSAVAADPRTDIVVTLPALEGAP